MPVVAETRVCQHCKRSFVVEPDDFSFYEKITVPPPTFCPECRMKRRFAWRNERNLYKRKDDRTGNEIFSGFPPTAPFKIWDKEYWISDAWDALEYARDYDFSRPFFEQFKELMHAVPWPSRSVIRLKNADYCDQAGDVKNGYLCFNCDHIEDSVYIVRSVEIKNSLDLTQSTHDELCYEGVSLSECNRTFFSSNCENCLGVWFSENCIGCTDCFGCANLRNKTHCFLNEQLSKEEYFKRLAELRLDSWRGLSDAAVQSSIHRSGFPVKYFHGIRAVDSTGEYLRHTKNVKQSWFVEDGQDIKYSQNVYLNAKDCYDLTVWGGGISLIYDSLTCGEEAYKVKFSFDCWPSVRNLEYCISCRSSSDLFGCVGLQKKKYCIFNKQYTEEEYKALRAKIVAHMDAMPYRTARGHTYSYGEYFPEEFSPFAYNETTLGDLYPLTKEEALTQGYAWRDPEAREYETSLDAAKLPDAIGEAPDSIIKELISCISCKRAYRIVATELAFLRHMQIPLPRQCPNCRLLARFAKINKPKYYHRRCMCIKNAPEHAHGASECPIEFETAYAPNRPEIVYCEKCYNAEVI